jgi:hypothetical protein
MYHVMKGGKLGNILLKCGPLLLLSNDFNEKPEKTGRAY